MKYFLKASFLALGLSISAFSAQVTTPSATGGNPFPDYAGTSLYRIASSTGGIVDSGKAVIVYGVATSSVSLTQYLQFYSTNAIQLSGATPAKVQWNDGVNSNSNLSATREYSWARPVLFPKGLVVKASANPNAGTDNSNEWVIYYREAN